MFRVHYGLHEHACMLMQSSRVLLVSFQACALACKIMYYWFYVYKQAFSLYACPFRRLRNMQSTTQHNIVCFHSVVLSTPFYYVATIKSLQNPILSCFLDTIDFLLGTANLFYYIIIQTITTGMNTIIIQ